MFDESWLACDASAAVCQANRGDTIASKPAPTMRPQGHCSDRSFYTRDLRPKNGWLGSL